MSLTKKIMFRVEAYKENVITKEELEQAIAEELMEEEYWPGPIW